MGVIDNRRVITIDSDNEDEPSWRGIRHEGTQSSEENIISGSPNGPRREDEGIGETEDFYQPLSAMTIKGECTDDCYDIDDYVYTQISFVDVSDDEDSPSPPGSPPSPPQAPIKTEPVDYPPEICRAETSDDFSGDLSVPDSTMMISARDIKRETLEDIRLQEEMDMSLYHEDFSPRMSFKSLNTSDHLQDLQLPRITDSNTISFDRNRRCQENSSDEDQNSSGNEREDVERVYEDEGLSYAPEETQNLNRLLSMLDHARFFDKNDGKASGIENSLNKPDKVPEVSKNDNSGEKNQLEEVLNGPGDETLEIEDSRDKIENSEENNSEKIGAEDKNLQEDDDDDKTENSEVMNSEEAEIIEEMSGISGGVGETQEMMSFSENIEEKTAEVFDPPQKGRGRGGAAADAEDPFMDISTQSQVLDFDEKFTDDESEESSSTGFDFSDDIVEDLETDDEPEQMDISSEESFSEEQMASIQNIPRVSGGIPGDDEIIGDDGIESLEGNNCRRETSTEKMEISTGGMSQEMNNDESHEIIENSSRSSTEEKDGETSGDIGNTGGNSGETVGDDKPVDESSKNDDVISLSTTMSDGFPDDDLDFGDTSEDDLDEATPIAESTGINITDWIHEGQKRRLEGPDDDFGVARAAKVQRFEGTMEDDDFSSKINPTESINLAAKESSSIITNLMSVDRSNTTCKLTPNTREDGALLYEREAEPMDASISHEISLHRADTLSLGMVVDIRESETSSGVSSGSPATSPTILLNTQEEDPLESPNITKKPKKPVRKYNLSSSSDESPSTSQKPSKPLQDSPKSVEHNYSNPKKPKKKFRKSLFLKKSKSPAVESPKPSKNPQNSIKRTPPSSIKPLKPRNSPETYDKIFSKIPLSQKRKKAAPVASDSSDEENSPKIERKPKNLKKKRKLYSRTDSIEDLSQCRSDLDERSLGKSPEINQNGSKSPEKRPEMMEKPGIIPVEHSRTPEDIIPSPNVDNPAPEASEQVERSKIFPVEGSELDFVTQGMDSSLTSPDTSASEFNNSLGAPGASVVLQNVSVDSEGIEESLDESLETGGSEFAGEKSPEAQNSEFVGEETSETSEFDGEKSPEAHNSEFDGEKSPEAQNSAFDGEKTSETSESAGEKSPEAQNSAFDGEKTPEPSESSGENPPDSSETAENSSPETPEVVDMDLQNSNNSPEESPESPDDSTPMDHSLTQSSHWTPSVPKKLIPLNSSPNKSPKPSQSSQNASALQPQPPEASPLGLEDIESMETVCLRPTSPEVMVPEPLIDPELTEDEEMPEDPIQEPETSRNSSPAPSPVIQQTRPQKSSPGRISHPPELSEDEETPKDLPEPLERIPRPPSPIPILTDDDSDPGTPLQPSKPIQEDQNLISSDEDTQTLTHISQLSKSPPISSTNTPKSSKDSSKSPRITETHDTDSGHGSGRSSIFRAPRTQNHTLRNDLIDDEASDGTSNCCDSIETFSNPPEDSEDQNLDDGRSKHSFSNFIKPKKTKKSKKPSPEPEPQPSTSSAAPLDLSHFNTSQPTSSNEPSTDATYFESLRTKKTIHKMQEEMRMKPADESRMQAPVGINVALYDHQEQALAWMLWREQCDPPGGILADDMGLGKTVTTISLIAESLRRDPQIKNRHNQRPRNPRDDKPLGGTLVVCPPNLLTQWHNEFRERSEIETIFKYHKEKEESSLHLSNYNVVLTTYETLSRNATTKNPVLFKVHWRRVVLDEAHVIRNPKAQKSLRIAELTTDKRWALTGTPVHNKIGDLYPVVRFLKLSPFDDKDFFNKWIDNDDKFGIKRLKGLMDCIMLRRTKDGLMTAGKMPELPMKTKRVIDIVLTVEERLVYDRVMTHSKTLFIQFLHDKNEKKKLQEIAGYMPTVNFKKTTLNKAQEKFLKERGIVERHHILALILRLRQICCHPYMIWKMLDKNDFKDAGIEEEKNNPGIEEILRQTSGNMREVFPERNGQVDDHDDHDDDDDDDDEEEIGVDKRVVQDDRIMCSKNPVFDKEKASSKMKAVLEKVREIISNGEKVVIVSDWVMYLRLIGEHLKNIPDVVFNFYIGDTSQNARDQIVEKFNKEEKPNVLLLSLRAGGQGLNLTAANHVILVDVHWNPQLEIQAEDRVYRIGQMKDVFIHKFICKDTIEERIVKLQDRKLKIAQDVLSGTQGQRTALGLEELCSLFGF